MPTLMISTKHIEKMPCTHLTPRTLFLLANMHSNSTVYSTQYAYKCMKPYPRNVFVSLLFTVPTVGFSRTHNDFLLCDTEKEIHKDWQTSYIFPSIATECLCPLSEMLGSVVYILFVFVHTCWY